jgi:hypothetical protein
MKMFLLVLLPALWGGSVWGADSLTAVEIAAAKKLHTAKCAKCHRFYQPADYTSKEWNEWMRKMSKKSKLTPEQDKLLSQYLDLCRAQEKKP